MTTTIETQTAALSVTAVSKTFGDRTVLRSVSLEVAHGEIHALLGQNGSGKSTLIKVLSGLHPFDAGGAVQIAGHHLGDAQATAKIAFVHQDLALVPSATVLENFCLGRFETGFGRRIKWGKNRADAMTAFARLGLSMNLDQPLAELSSTDRAFLAIARALHRLPDAGMLVLDEPTAYLPADGVESLHEVMRKAAAHGVGIIFVTHDIDEALSIADRVSVLRDGALVATLNSAETTSSQIVGHMVGGEVDLETPTMAHHTESYQRDRVAMTVTAFETPRVSVERFEAHRGEVVGLTGLLGSGYEELVYAAFGALPGSVAGSMSLDDEVGEIAIKRATPALMMKRGVAFIPADRRGSGSLPTFEAVDNLTLADLGAFRGRGRRMDRRKELSWARSAMESFAVRPAEPRQEFARFSGGNQQKMVLAKWMRRNPEVLLVHEPTQGVDIEARYIIYTQLRALARSGKAVVVATADADELPLLCDRVLVFRRGRIVGELRGPAVQNRAISALSFGTSGETKS